MTDQVNIPLLRKAVEWAEAEAAKRDVDCQWEQREWMSRPQDRAWLIASRRAPEATGSQSKNLVAAIAPEISCGTCYCIAGYIAQSLDERYAEATYVDGKWSEDFAAEALGLDAVRAWPLFKPTNTIVDVRRIAEDIAGERL